MLLGIISHNINTTFNEKRDLKIVQEKLEFFSQNCYAF